MKLLPTWLTKLLRRPEHAAPVGWQPIGDSSWVSGEYMLQANGPTWLLYAANAQWPSVGVTLPLEWTQAEFELACDELVLRLQGHARSSQRAATRILNSRAKDVLITPP